MDKMILLLSAFCTLSEEETELVRALAEPVQFKPGQLFRLADWISGQGIAFLDQGVVLTCPDPGRPGILIDAGNFLSDKHAASAAEETLQALTGIELIVLDNGQCDILSFLIPQWDKIMDSIHIMMLADRLERFKAQVTGSARLRYLYLVEHYPVILQQVPLQQIAAHLGITSQSLSRIRNHLAYMR